MDRDKKSPPRARAGKATSFSGGRGSGDTGCVVDATVAGPPAEPPARAADQAQPVPTAPWCAVHGDRVSEFRALIDGKPGTLITDKGSWVFDRVFFERSMFNLGDGWDRTLAGQRVIGAEFTSEGLTVHLADYRVWIPAESIKASWRLPVAPT